MIKKRSEIHKELIDLGNKITNINISELQKSDNLKENIVEASLVQLDYSKQKLSNEGKNFLFEIPDLINLRESLEALTEGNIKNPTEDKNVSHTIYRDAFPQKDFSIISSERKRIKEFLEKNLSDKKIKNLICLGIGGSRLGPELLYEFQNKSGPIDIHFCSSYDLLEQKQALADCKQKETIAIISSKSFETREIMKNFEYLKSWYQQKPGIDLKSHLYAISSDKTAMTQHGFLKENQFEILESLGGRFSIWSAMSIPAFVNSGYAAYQDLLEGARLADSDTLTSKWDENIAVILALLSVWNCNALNINNHGIFSYSFRLRSLAKHLSQLSMESNGKTINYKGEENPFNSSPLVWGGYGVEAQHSSFQWIMQSKTETACDFISINDGEIESCASQGMLLSQVLAMTFGETNDDEPYKSVEGNNPCSILQLRSGNLKDLGYLLALYEHKIFIEALILGINPFDQWGVQLGKKIVSKSSEDKEHFVKYFSNNFLPKS